MLRTRYLDFIFYLPF